MANCAINSCTRLDPIDKAGLEALIKAGKENPDVIKTLKCRTVAEGKFRHSNYIRDTAPNPSEAVLAALGSCIAVGIHANAIAQNIVITKLEVELEGDLNITAVWGTGDLSEKPLGFTDVRVNVVLESNADKAKQDALIAHALKYSPVANTLLRNVNLEVK